MNKISSFKGEYAFLSNFAMVGNLSVEHYYQAGKTTDVDLYNRILAAPTPAAAKKMARGIELRTDWEGFKVGYMLHLLRWKFSQEPFKAELLKTGDVLLEEGNWWGDTFWGVCKGEGHNVLGKLLMQVRNEIRTQNVSRQHKP